MKEFPHTEMFDSDLREIVEKYLTVKDLPDKWLAFEKLVSGEVEDLKKFVNNYFNNLNVQNEINNKLDAMAKDGSLTNLIKPIFEEFQRTINVLNARMDTFTSLSEGASVGDAELSDAHVDYKGEIHANVGEHIRNITNELNSDINQIAEKEQSINMFNKSKRELNKYIKYETGATSEIDTFDASEYYPVIKDRTYGIYGLNFQHFAFYYANKIYFENTKNDLRTFNGGSFDPHTPSNDWVYFKSPVDGFVRFSVKKSDVDKAMFILCNEREDGYHFKYLYDYDCNIYIPYGYKLYSKGEIEAKTKVPSAHSSVPVLYSKNAKIIEWNGSAEDNVIDYLKYPLTPIWGHEYMYPFYEKIFNTENHIQISIDGDSTNIWHYRKSAISKIFRVGGYPSENITVTNNGFGSRSTQEYAGTGLYYSHESDKIDYPNGIIAVSMEQNPDLLIMGYGINDATIDYFNTEMFSIEQRIALYKQNMEEILQRVRGNQPINGRPAYNRNAEDLSIIICVPHTTHRSHGSIMNLSRDTWTIYLRPVIQELCREYKCAYADFSLRHYDHEYSSNWSKDGDRLHQTEVCTYDFMSIMQDLVYPICLWNK